MRQTQEQPVVLRFGSSESPIEILERSRRQGVRNHSKALAAPRLHYAGYHQSVQQIKGRPATNPLAQLQHVDVLAIGAEHQTSFGDLPVHLLKVVELLARELNHRGD